MTSRRDLVNGTTIRRHIESQDDMARISTTKLVGASFKIAWRHKVLWLFGAFVGSLGHVTEYLLEGAEIGALGDNNILGALSKLISEPASVLVLTLGGLVATPALVSAVSTIAQGGQHYLSGSLKAIKSIMWQVMGFWVTTIVLGGAAAYVSLNILRTLWTGSTGPLLSLAIVIVAIVFIVLLWGMVLVFGLGWSSLIIGKRGIKNSLLEAWILFRDDKSTCFWTSFLGGAASFVVSIPFLIVSYIILENLPHVFTSIGLVESITGVLVSVLYILVWAAWNGFILTFGWGLYTLLYLQLVEPGTANRRQKARLE